MSNMLIQNKTTVYIEMILKKSAWWILSCYHNISSVSDIAWNVCSTWTKSFI